MFRLSDATRRQTTLGLFILLCVLPTVAVILIGGWRCLPGRVVAEEGRLSLLFGQPVHIEVVRHLRPGAALYQGVEVLDPETNEVLLRCDWLRARFDTVEAKGAKASSRQLQLSVGKLTVTAASIEALRPMADRLLQRRIEGLPPSAVLAAKELVLKGDQEEFLARQVGVWATLQAEESKVEVNFQLEGQSKPAYLCLVRYRNYQPPVDGFLLATGDGCPLPCSLLTTILPHFQELGKGSRFHGWINGSHVPEGWQLKVNGELQGIDLRKLVADHLPHEISGTGTLRLDEFEIRAGRISVMKGSLSATNGSISRDLVASCVRELGLTTTFPIDGSNARLLYDELGAGFQLDGSGLRIWGECESGPAGALLVAYAYRLDGPLASTGPIRPTKAIAALTSTPELQLSMSRHAAGLVSRVPFIPTAQAVMIADPRGASQHTGRF